MNNIYRRYLHHRLWWKFRIWFDELWLRRDAAHIRDLLKYSGWSKNKVLYKHDWEEYNHLPDSILCWGDIIVVNNIDIGKYIKLNLPVLKHSVENNFCKQGYELGWHQLNLIYTFTPLNKPKRKIEFFWVFLNKTICGEPSFFPYRREDN